MADTKITGLPALTAPIVTDILPIVDDPAGTPITSKVTVANLIGLIYPVGSIYISTSSTNPGTTFGVGTWSAFGAGCTLVSLDSGQSEFDTVEETGGAKTHTLTSAEMPAHVHRMRRNATTTGALSGLTTAPDASSSNPADLGTLDTGSTGGGAAHNNLQPYIVVYMFKRTA